MSKQLDLFAADESAALPRKAQAPARGDKPVKRAMADCLVGREALFSEPFFAIWLDACAAAADGKTQQVRVPRGETSS